MGTPSSATAQYVHLTDRQLIELLPETDDEKFLERNSPHEQQRFKEEPEDFIKPLYREVLNELWNRYHDPVQRKVASRIKRLCPPQHGDPEAFSKEVFSNAYLAFLRRIRKRDAKGQQYESFEAYLFTLFIRVGLDLRRALVGRHREESDETNHNIENGTEPTGRSPGRKRSKKLPVQPPTFVPIDEARHAATGKDPLQMSTEKQFREILLRVMKEHAAEHPTSARALYVHGAEGATWEQLAKELYPPELSKSSFEARKQKVRRLFEDDRVKVARKLRSKYGVSGAHVLHFRKEAVGAEATDSDLE